MRPFATRAASKPVTRMGDTDPRMPGRTPPRPVDPLPFARAPRRRIASGIATGVAVVAAAPWRRVRAAPRRIALLENSNPTISRNSHRWFTEGLTERGLVEGRDFILDARFAAFEPSRLPGLARELLAGSPALLVAPGPAAAAAAMAIAGDTPVLVMGDPVLAGQATALRQPGGRVTGVSILFEPLNHKRIEWLAAVCTRGARIMLLGDQQVHETAMPKLRETAQRFGLEVVAAYARTAAELEAAIAEAKRQAVDGLNQLNSPFIWGQRQWLYRQITALRIPAIYQWAGAAAEGGLMAYGPRSDLMWKQLAGIARRVLDGESPSRIPIEQPTHIHLTLNKSAAREIGLKFPATVLARADEIVD